MARNRSDIENADLEGNPIEKADVENTEKATAKIGRTVSTTEAVDGDPRYPISKVGGDERTADGPDEPDQNDVTVAVKAHNDAEIAKAEDALTPDVPEGTRTTSSAKYQR